MYFLLFLIYTLVSGILTSLTWIIVKLSGGDIDKNIFLGFILYFLLQILLTKMFYPRKITLIRKYIKFLRSIKKVDYLTKKEPLNKYQIKAIDIWKKTLSDKKSRLNSCISSDDRQVILNDLTLLLSQANDNEYVLTIIDSTPNNKHLFEIVFFNNQFLSLIKEFDVEMNRRMGVISKTKKLEILSKMDDILKS